MKRLFLLLALLFPSLAFAQGGILSGGILVLSSSGRPVPGATVTVCNVSDNGIPCTQTVSIYKDPALTIPAANPGTTDGNGNFIVFAAQGSYHYTVTGNGVTTVGQPFSTTALCSQNCQPTAQVFYAPISCDNSTNVTSTLNTFLASVAGTSPAKVILPGGTCLVTSNIGLPDNLWLSGSGVANTIVKQITGTNDGSHPIFLINGTTGNVTISDMTIDGNKAGQSTGLSLVGNSQTGDMSSFKTFNTTYQNAWTAAISFTVPTGHLIKDFDIRGNTFTSNSTATTQLQDQSGTWGDISIRAPFGGKIQNNTSNGGQSDFIIFGTNAGNPIGHVNISGNNVTGALGFGVALGGGGGFGTDAVIDGNYFNMPNARENVIDVANWNASLVSDNMIYWGTCTFCSGIGDGPPSSATTILNNTLVANFNQVTPGLCIGNGGNTNISNNFCYGGGIGLQLAANTVVDGAVIEGNTVINARPGNPGFQTLLSGGSSLSNVLIKGNHFYDNQSPHTQTYGITLGVVGAATGYSNITIEGNDVRNNLTGGMRIATSGATGLVIRGNPGYDPLTDNPVDVLGTANIGQTTIYTVPSVVGSLMYKVHVSGGVSRQATSTSTCPSINIIWTDADSNVQRTFTITPNNASGNNNQTTYFDQSLPIYANTATAIAYSTTGYASSGATSMQYSLHIRLEAAN